MVPAAEVNSDPVFVPAKGGMFSCIEPAWSNDT